MQRRILPQRRSCETFEISFGGLAKSHTITLGFYDDGVLGEVFINGGKSGEQVEAIARDGAVLLSLGTAVRGRAGQHQERDHAR
ncbi:hypothetical protein HU675_0026065 [Bradyrhizobium septentrionale]|uniref:TSCPD domain-containing protein n=1 Tax=Bradyrhizobium septentrionale TaxID=1404411 RepID=UPI001596E6BD|nr:hypothetical protein [Bradyrhizobium septentrionale]UGY21495.1 hypothetical protein HU675_0026065 [Bradyrhizobium septentrionale]